MPDETRYGFGKNWEKYLAQVNDDRKRIARDSIVDFIGLADLRGKTFIDIGCGSGLFSLAAHDLGAEKIISFDYDPFSVQCCEHLHDEAGKPGHWCVSQGSVLDDAMLQKLGRFDVVYSWGVLHHTGEMWQAIKNAADRVAPGGLFYISIYNKKKGVRGSKYWARRKKLYCNSPEWVKRVTEGLHYAYYFQSRLLRGRNPIKTMKNYRSKRGMDWYRDLCDWLGGYPYEYATVQEIFDYMHQLDRKFVLENLSSGDGLGTNSFLFRCVEGEAVQPAQ